MERNYCYILTALQFWKLNVLNIALMEQLKKVKWALEQKFSFIVCDRSWLSETKAAFSSQNLFHMYFRNTVTCRESLSKMNCSKAAQNEQKFWNLKVSLSLHDTALTRRQFRRSLFQQTVVAVPKLIYWCFIFSKAITSSLCCDHYSISLSTRSRIQTRSTGSKSDHILSIRI